MMSGQEYLDGVRKRVADYGWMVQAVAPDATQPAFQYTVGAWEFAGMELIVFGLPPNLGGTLLNQLAKRMHNGERFLKAVPLRDILSGYPAMMLTVSDSSRYLTVANALYRLTAPVPALQLVFPDRDRRWPWDEGSEVAETPLLGTPPH